MLERISYNTRIQKHLVRLMQTYSTLEGRLQAEILEEALTEYFQRHKVLEQVREGVDRIGQICDEAFPPWEGAEKEKPPQPKPKGRKG